MQLIGLHMMMGRGLNEKALSLSIHATFQYCSPLVFLIPRRVGEEIYSPSMKRYFSPSGQLYVLLCAGLQQSVSICTK